MILMEIESLEIFQYLSSCDPISKLEVDIQKKIALNIQIIYFKRGQTILKPGEINQWLYIIRSGAVARNESSGSVVAKFSEKDFFGQASLQRAGKIERQVKAIEDTLLYRISDKLFFELLNSSPYFQFYFNRGNANFPHRKQLDFAQKSSNINYLRARELLHDKPIMVDHKLSVSECAKQMQKTGATSLLITQNEQVKGIVTDRAFCTKVVADNLSHESPVGLIMTENLLTIDEQSTASEALLIMARHNIRHLPVIEEEQVLGVLTATDLIHRQSNNPIYLINQIYKADSVEKLVKLAAQLPQTLCRLVKNGHNAKETGYSISSIGRAINCQLLKLAEKKLGQPPIEYAWVIAGSLARNDQTGYSDQDNALLLHDDYNEAEHGDYFQQLAKFVCDGLNLCGYFYCPGDVMATNPKWRQPLKIWQKYFNNWIVTPEPKALMYASIFFDLSAIFGQKKLLNELKQFMRELILKNQRFLTFMTANALQHRPPLGLFRNFVLEKHGAEEKTLNLKKRGIVPIIDLARIYALACGASPINTLERLKVSCDNQALTQTGFMDLSDALDFLSQIRLEHQARQIDKGLKADNYLPPEELSSLERRHLKDVFEIISTYQKALESHYSAGLLG